MFQAITHGIVIGLTLCFTIGPVFFALIDTSISRGFREAAKFALGICASDVAYAAIISLGVGTLIAAAGTNPLLPMVGGVILIVLGLATAFKEAKKQVWVKPERTDIRRRFSSVGKGFVLNTFNPGTPIIWLGASASAGAYQNEGGAAAYAAFIISILAMVFATDLSKAYLAGKLKRFITPATIAWVNKIVGLIMIVAGLFFLAKAFEVVTWL